MSGTIVTYGIVQAGEETANGVPYIRTGDIVASEIAARQLRRTAPKIAAQYARSRVRTGDIVMSIRATVGTTAVVPPELDGANLTQGTARIAPSERVQGSYLLNLLRAPEVQHWIQRQVKGATFREITLARLRELPVRVPPPTLQQVFARRAAQVDAMTANQRESLRTIEGLCASLRHSAFFWSPLTMPSQASVQRAPSNFEFLKAAWPDLAAEAAKAERSAAADPRTACFYARRSLELGVQWMYDADRSLRRPYKDDLSAMLFEPSFQAVVDQRIRAKMDYIRRVGNSAVHDRRPTKVEAAVGAVRELFHVMFWIARTYARGREDVPHPSLAFNDAAIPRPLTSEQRQASRCVTSRLKTLAVTRSLSVHGRTMRLCRRSLTNFVSRSSRRRPPTW